MHDHNHIESEKNKQRQNAEADGEFVLRACFKGTKDAPNKNDGKGDHEQVEGIKPGDCIRSRCSLIVSEKKHQGILLCVRNSKPDA